MLYARELVQSNIWLFERQPGNRKVPPKATRLTSGTGFDISPSISPDQQSVAFVRGEGPPANVFTIPIHGGEEEQLTFTNSINASPVWSPRGNEIAFESKLPKVFARSGYAGEFYMVAQWFPKLGVLENAGEAIQGATSELGRALK